MSDTIRQIEEHCAWLEEQAERELQEVRALVDEARSRARMSCACKDMKGIVLYPLMSRIVEMARASIEKI